MSAVAKLLAQKQQLLDRLASNPGPNERQEIETQLAKIDTVLTWLEPNDPVEEGREL